MDTPQPSTTENMKILRLTLKKKWFDIIASGEKKEEYREIKPYWLNRLTMRDEFIGLDGRYFKTFDTVEFANGYAKNAPSFTIECKGIEIGPAKPEWSDNWQGDVFVIKLGEIIN